MREGPARYTTSWTKTLSEVEVNPEKSHQHEFNGVNGLKAMLGESRFSSGALFSVEGEPGEYRSDITWYDAREMHPTRSEYRLYFKTNPVMESAVPGDNMVISRTPDGDLYFQLIRKENNTGMRTTRRWQKL